MTIIRSSLTSASIFILWCSEYLTLKTLCMYIVNICIWCFLSRLDVLKWTNHSSNRLLAMPPPGRYSGLSVLWRSSSEVLSSSDVQFSASCENLSLCSASKSGVAMYRNWDLQRRRANICIFVKNHHTDNNKII